MICRAGILLAVGADEGAALDAGDVAGVGSREEGVGSYVRIKSDECAIVNHLRRQALPFSLGAVTPNNLVRLG